MLLRYKKTLIFTLSIFLLLGVLCSLDIIGKKQYISFVNDKKVLNLIAKIYFDEEYYLEKYPEIAKLNISPFEHYSTIGWEEGKNPSKNFDTNFYKIANLSYRQDAKELNPLQDYVKCKLEFKECYANPTQLKKVKLLKNPKYYLAIVALFRDEARFLKEWIEFHRLMGVEHFYLYNHLSKDDYMSVLEPYIKEGIVELDHLMYEPITRQEWREKVQWKTYSDAVNKVKDDVEWLAIIDSDEFLFPVKDKNLKEKLKEYDNYASLSVNWKIFGSGKVNKIEENQLLIQSLVMSEKDKNSYVKTIVKPRYIENFIDPHFAILKQGYGQITENYEYFYGAISPYQSRNILAINHYYARDWEFFRNYKLARIHIKDNDLIDDENETKLKKQINHNKEISSVYDDLILRFVPELRLRMFNE